ncbi:MAG: YbjN domain-containing protein [Pseudomonadota bacterium]
MRSRTSTSFMAIAALTMSIGFTTPNTAQAADKMYTNISGSELVELMQDWGYRATLGVDDYDDPLVSSSASGVNFDVFFYDCNTDDPKRCESLMLTTVFDFEEAVPLTVANDWNLNNRFGRAYIDNEGDPIIELDYEMLGGVTAGNLHQTFKYWENTVGDFSEKIGWR